MSQTDSSTMHALCTKILSSPTADFLDAFYFFARSPFGEFQINSYLDCMHIKMPRMLLTQEWRRSMVVSGESIFTLQYQEGERPYCTIFRPDSVTPDHLLIEGIPEDELKAEHIMVGRDHNLIRHFHELPWLQEAVTVLRQHADSLG